MESQNKTMTEIRFEPLAPQHFERIIALGNQVHGDNYLDVASLQDLYLNSFQHGINASLVSLDGDTLIGFRLTIAAKKWKMDKWCSADKWLLPSEQVCYFKCNTVDDAYRGLGIGSKLLSLSIEKARHQGAKAGLAHIWLASPGNSAYKYFSKCGGKLIAEHPGKWRHLSIEEGYCCPVCNDICECVAAEMLLEF
ncbi:GNAT family N-acetyltransferase [Aliiglaciecola sp. LCG003]|uniref:GNAT family N-acetyltransferase n=1 Tax=Aliiglaciecola sp. LCG003 TaxID=3053655 RepID=UPI0025734A4A|nr:GNAT family N-acetyltransferase [Aliiglaciecola sp. LCG003]WJG08891.1 GNAT family N-acetyltransferase [Aliiglaciecola sp. LCG003]